jgi:hypothetical protein
LWNPAVLRERYVYCEAIPQSLQSRINPWWSVHCTALKRLALCGLLSRPLGLLAFRRGDVVVHGVALLVPHLDGLVELLYRSFAFCVSALGNRVSRLFGLLLAITRSLRHWRQPFVRDPSGLKFTSDLKRTGLDLLPARQNQKPRLALSIQVWAP